MLPSTRILRAVIAAIRPRGHGFDQPIDDDVLGDIQRFFPYLPWPLRLGLPLGLWLVELGPPPFARRWCRFTSMAAGEAARDLAAFEHAGGLRSALRPTETFVTDPATMIRRLYRDAGTTMILGRPPIIFVEGRCVGGSTVINGGMS